MRTLLSVLLLLLIAAPASAQTCRRTGDDTRCSDGSAIRLVDGRWLYRPSPAAKVLPWTAWPFPVPARDVRPGKQPRLVSP